MDEITQYGYRAKLISLGYSKDQLAVEGWPLFGEAIMSLFYSKYYGILFIRYLKLLLLILSGLIVIKTLALFINISIKLKIILLGIFLATPEFTYMGLSLKTDNINLFFDSIFVYLSVLYIFNKNKNFLSRHNYDKFLPYLIFIFAIASLGVRISSISIILPFAFIIIFLELKNKKFHFALLLLYILFFGSIICYTYIENIFKYTNPFYPLNIVNLNLENYKFSPDWDINYRKSLYNLESLNKLQQFIFLPVYMSLGLGTQIGNYFSFIPHPIDKGVAIGWINPFFLGIYLLPVIFIKEQKTYKIFIAILLFSYLIWFGGIHYTRTYLYGFSAFSLIIFSFLYQRIEGKMKLYFNLGILLILVSLFVYHFSYLKVKYFYNCESNCLERYVRGEIVQEYYEKELGVSWEKLPLNSNDFKILDNAIGNLNLPIVGIENSSFNHIFFSNGYFKDVEYSKNDCYIFNIENLNLQQSNLDPIVITNSIGLFCKKDSRLF